MADALVDFNEELVRRSGALVGAVCHELARIDARPVDDATRERVRAQIAELLAEPLRDPADPVLGGTTARGRAELAQGCRVAVRRGLPIDDLLRGFRASLEVGLDFCEATATELGAGHAVRLAASRRLLAWSDLAMAEASAAYRQELIPTTDRLQRYAPALAAVRAGVAVTDLQARDLETAGFELAATWHAVVACPDRGGAVDRVAREILPHPEARLGVLAVVDGLVLALVATPPAPSADVRAGVGPAASGSGLTASFEVAGRALEAVTALGLRGAHTLPALGVRAAVATDRQLGDVLVERYVTPVAALPAGADVLDAVSAYLAADASVRSAAEQLGVHQNTVRYRLGRYEALTGADLRVLVTRFEVWWALTSTSRPQAPNSR